MAKHIIEDKYGRQIQINVENHAKAQSYFTHLLLIGEDRLGQCAGHGICGQCRFRIKKGKFIVVQESLYNDLPLDQGLSCSSAPKPGEDSHIVLSNYSFRSY